MIAIMAIEIFQIHPFLGVNIEGNIQSHGLWKFLKTVLNFDNLSNPTETETRVYQKDVPCATDNDNICFPVVRYKNLPSCGNYKIWQTISPGDFIDDVISIQNITSYRWWQGCHKLIMVLCVYSVVSPQLKYNCQHDLFATTRSVGSCLFDFTALIATDEVKPTIVKALRDLFRCIHLW